MRESLIQNGIIHYLTILEAQNKLYFIRNNSFSGFVQQRNGFKSFIKNAKKGSPDILLCVRGGFVAFEVKTDIGRQSIEQKQTQEKIEACGGKYYIIRSIDEVQNILLDFGVK